MSMRAEVAHARNRIGGRLGWILLILAGISVAGGAIPRVSASPVAQWSPVASLPAWLHYNGNMAAVTGPDDRVYALGTGTSSGNSLAAYTPATDSWAPVAPEPHGSTGSAATRGADGRIYVMTGFYGAVDVYDVCAGTWGETSVMPVVRQSMAAASSSDGRIFAIGGNVDNQNSTNTVDAYDPATDRWTPVAPMPTARGDLAAVSLPDGSIYAMGGSTRVLGRDTNFSNAVEKYTPGPPGTPGTWATVHSMKVSRDRLAAAVGSDGLIYVMGGQEGTPTTIDSGVTTESVEVYNPATDTWADAPPMSTPRQALGAARGPDGRIYAVGGYPSFTGQPMDSVEALPTGTLPRPGNGLTCRSQSSLPVPSFTPGAWSSIAPMSTPRTDLAAATGPDGRIYAIGGSLGNGFTEGVTTVEAYNPHRNTWTTVKPMNEGRRGPAATTGPDGRIYVIGGGPLTVEAYDTARDQWQYVPDPGRLISYEAAITARNGWIYEMGGLDCPRVRGAVTCPPTSDVRRWRPGSSSWQDVSPMPSPNSQFGVALGAKGLIYAMGGSLAGPAGGNTVQGYDVKSDSWSQSVAPMINAHSAFPGASTLDGQVLAVGGGGVGNAGVEDYVGCANRWEPVAPLLTGRRGHAAATGPDGRVYIMGGTPPDAKDPLFPVPTNSAEAYTPVPPPNPAPPGCASASITDAAPVARPSYGPAYATFTVSVSPPATQNASVAYSTQDGQDGSGYVGAIAGRDYEPTSGVLQFPVGTTTRTISVPVDPTTRAGPSSQFYVNLSNPAGVYLGNSRATGTILASADVPYSGPSLGIGDVSVIRTHATVVPALFTVTLGGPAPTHRITVDYVTQDGQGPNGAVQGTDYQFTQGTLDFEPGDPPSQQIRVGIIGSSETGGPDRTFSVALSNPTNAGISRGVGTGTISDALDGLSIGDSTVVEPSTGSVPTDFAVTLSDALDHPVTVRYASRNGSAAAGRDYRATSGTLTFPPGDQEEVVEVPVLADPTPDGTEQFLVQLGNPAGTVLSKRSTGTGTILEQDTGWTIPGTPGTPGTPGYLIPGQQIPLTHSIVTTTVHQQAVQQAVQAQQQAQAQQQLQQQSQAQNQVQIQAQPGLMMERQRQIQLQKEGIDGRTLLASGRAGAAVAWAPVALLLPALVVLGWAAGRRPQAGLPAEARSRRGPRRSGGRPPSGRFSRRLR